MAPEVLFTARPVLNHPSIIDARAVTQADEAAPDIPKGIIDAKISGPIGAGGGVAVNAGCIPRATAVAYAVIPAVIATGNSIPGGGPTVIRLPCSVV